PCCVTWYVTPGISTRSALDTPPAWTQSARLRKRGNAKVAHLSHLRVRPRSGPRQTPRGSRPLDPSLGGGDHGGLVDRVGREVVELRAQEIARRRGIAFRRGELFSAQAHAEGRRRLDGTHRSIEPRVQPPANQLRFRTRAADADLLLANPRPVVRQLAPPAV